MPLAIPSTPPLPAGLLPERLQVERVLYEAEIPIVYLTRILGGQLTLAYVAYEDENGTFTLLSPIASRTLRGLEDGAISVRDALGVAGTWLHLDGGDHSRVWSVNLDTFSDDFLPRPGTPLHAHQQPILRTRAVGNEIVLGRMPASVVSFVAESTRKAIKTLLDFILANPSEGRPREEHRALYDLPIQSFAFASFELSFGAPSDAMFPSEELRDAADKLARGLAWASSESRETVTASSNEEREAILRATLFLTPPSSGPIREMQLSGAWLRDEKIVLTRRARKRIRTELKPLDSERIVTYKGRIGRVDLDNLTFILRDTESGLDITGGFAEELLGDMIDLLGESDRVEVAGFEIQGRLNVTAIASTRQQSPN